MDVIIIKFIQKYGSESLVCFFTSDQAVKESTMAASNGRADDADRRRLTDLWLSKPPTGTSSLQRDRVQHLQQASGSLRRGPDDAGAILRDEEDVFVVGQPGGTFQSTTDPDVSIYIPPSAVTDTVTLTMQVHLTCGSNRNDIRLKSHTNQTTEHINIRRYLQTNQRQNYTSQ